MKLLKTIVNDIIELSAISSDVCDNEKAFVLMTFNGNMSLNNLNFQKASYMSFPKSGISILTVILLTVKISMTFHRILQNFMQFHRKL
jgi:hypothetical protein